MYLSLGSNEIKYFLHLWILDLILIQKGSIRNGVDLIFGFLGLEILRGCNRASLDF
jgi:hypothetical protein